MKDISSKDIGLLALRLVAGGLMAGHGAQKLFGWYGGHGLQGTAGWLQSQGFNPPRPWALLAGISELGGGVLTALGAANPVGPLSTIGAMSMATVKAHWGKPIWGTSGGAELPVTNIAIAVALGLSGPGKLSLDNAVGVRLPRRLVFVPGLALVAASVAAGVALSAGKPAVATKEAPVQAESITAESDPEESVAVRIEGINSDRATTTAQDGAENSFAIPEPISPDNPS